MENRIPGFGKDQILYVAEDFDAPMELTMQVPVPNTNEQNYAGTYRVPQPQHVCPNCGHCPCCGRGGYQFQPWPGYPQPYVGDLPGWMQYGPTWGALVGTSSIGRAYGGSTQVWN